MRQRKTELPAIRSGQGFRSALLLTDGAQLSVLRPRSTHHLSRQLLLRDFFVISFPKTQTEDPIFRRLPRGSFARYHFQ
jgi:hypothetical protein